MENYEKEESIKSKVNDIIEVIRKAFPGASFTFNYDSRHINKGDTVFEFEGAFVGASNTFIRDFKVLVVAHSICKSMIREKIGFNGR